MTRRLALTIFSATLALGSIGADVARAGCGCEKPPPVPAELRPRATYAGTTLTIFDPALVAGAAYRVVFTSTETGASAPAEGIAVRRRDLADAVTRVQLPVLVPDLPVGPTAIAVYDGGRLLRAVGDSDFTLVPQPVVIPATGTSATYPGYRAAVGRSGVVYVSLDLSQIKQPLVIRAQLRGYPLRFSGTDATFYNVQGFLMQLLDGSIPGLYTLDSATSARDSDVLQYSRHEFNSYFLQHAERLPHALDPTDPNWHLDGSRHIDHDHLVLALTATLASGATPVPGQAPASDLVIDTFSLFSDGLTGVSGVTIETLAGTSSYDSRTLATGKAGDVLTGGVLTMQDGAFINGSAAAQTFDLGQWTSITGAMCTPLDPVRPMPVQIPSGLADLGTLVVNQGESRVLTGPNSFAAARLEVADGGRLIIDNAAGPVTLYVSGPVQLSGLAMVSIADPSPEKFALYVAGPGPVSVSEGSLFAGVVYAPDAAVTIEKGGQFYGAFTGDTVVVRAGSVVHYDTALRGETGGLVDLALVAPTPTPTTVPTLTSKPTTAPTLTSTPTTVQTPKARGQQTTSGSKNAVKANAR